MPKLGHSEFSVASSCCHRWRKRGKIAFTTKPIFCLVNFFFAYLFSERMLRWKSLAGGLIFFSHCSWWYDLSDQLDTLWYHSIIHGWFSKSRWCCQYRGFSPTEYCELLFFHRGVLSRAQQTSATPADRRWLVGHGLDSFLRRSPLSCFTEQHFGTIWKLIFQRSHDAIMTKL